jgi:hypothetical protein
VEDDVLAVLSRDERATLHDLLLRAAEADAEREAAAPAARG